MGKTMVEIPISDSGPIMALGKLGILGFPQSSAIRMMMVRMEGRTTEEGKRQKLQVKRDLKSNTLCNTINRTP